MKEEKISTTNNVELVHLPEGSIMVMRIKGFLRASEFSTERARINQITRQKNIRNIVLNQSGMLVLSKEMQAFLIQTSDDFVRNGIKKLAAIPPKDLFAQAGLANVISQIKTDTIEVKQFQSEPEGIAWIQS